MTSEKRDPVVPGEHYAIYGDLGMRCFYCGFEAGKAGDPETAFWAYRQFDVDHIVPRNRIPDTMFMVRELTKLVGEAYAGRAALVIKEFNQVPACHSCNTLLNAYPGRACGDKVEAFFKSLAPGVDMDQPSHPTEGENEMPVVLARVKEAILNVWEDKRDVLLPRLNEERQYYRALYVAKVGMPALLSLDHPVRREAIGPLRQALEERWQKLLNQTHGMNL